MDSTWLEPAFQPWKARTRADEFLNAFSNPGEARAMANQPISDDAGPRVDGGAPLGEEVDTVAGRGRLVGLLVREDAERVVPG